MILIQMTKIYAFPTEYAFLFLRKVTFKNVHYKKRRSTGLTFRND